MRCIEQKRIAEFFHYREAEHIDDEIIVAKATAPLAQQKPVIARVFEFFQDVAHLLRC